MVPSDIAEIITFSQEHSWKPVYPPSLVKRFLNDLISSPQMVFDKRVGGERIAAAVLIDQIRNPANDACLEILGIRAGADVKAVHKEMIEFCKLRTPKTKSGFQMGIPENSPELEDLVLKAGLRHHYDTYEMKRDNLVDIGDNAIAGVERAGSHDAALVYRLLVDSFQKNPDTSIPAFESFERGFERPTSVVFLYRKGFEALGFTTLLDQDGEAVINTIGVLPQARGQGIGAKLLQQALQEAKARGFKSCHLTVAVQNKKALELYKRAGFRSLEANHCFRWTRT